MSSILCPAPMGTAFVPSVLICNSAWFVHSGLQLGMF